MTTYDKNSQFEFEKRGSLKSIGFPPNHNKAMNLKCKNCGFPWKDHSVHTENHPAGLCPYNPLKELS